MNMADIRQHLITGMTGTCLICGAYPLLMNPTEYFNEYRCDFCQMPYQGLKWKGEAKWLAQFGLTREQTADLYCYYIQDIDWLKQYWQETHTPFPLGRFIDLPGWTPEQEDRFYTWLDNHPEINPVNITRRQPL